jgi:hypothetical protein
MKKVGIINIAHNNNEGVITKFIIMFTIQFSRNIIINPYKIAFLLNIVVSNDFKLVPHSKQKTLLLSFLEPFRAFNHFEYS